MGREGGFFLSFWKLYKKICEMLIFYPNFKKNDKFIGSFDVSRRISGVFWYTKFRDNSYKINHIYVRPSGSANFNNILLNMNMARWTAHLMLRIPTIKDLIDAFTDHAETKSFTNDEECSDATIRTELYGVVRTKYKFNNMCDFQYVPLVSLVDESSQECVYDDLVPKGMEKADWLNQPAPLFLPPAAFSRMDTPQDYRYRREANTDNKSKLPQNIICRTRQRRTHFAIFYSFKDEGVPTMPLPGAMSQIRVKFMDNELYSGLQKEFQKRPIWSKNALKVRLGYSRDKLKYLLPTQSYYFHTGPWRNLWIVFGYDPRKDPTAWIYQTFDYRIRQAGGVKTKVEAKRSYSNYVLPYKSSNTSRRKIAIALHLSLNQGGIFPSEDDVAMNAARDLYCMNTHMSPQFTQMSYEYFKMGLPDRQKRLSSYIKHQANQVQGDERGLSANIGYILCNIEGLCWMILKLVAKSMIQFRTQRE
ncbi:unnamed protein product, partial [Meganyctiphanes norvegica]